MSNNNCRIFKNSHSFIKCINNFLDIVTVNIDNRPIKSLEFLNQRFHRHHIFCKPVYLNIIPVDNCRYVVEIIFPGKHYSLPTLTLIKLSVTHQTINPRHPLTSWKFSARYIHFYSQGVTNCLRKPLSQWSPSILYSGKFPKLRVTLKTTPKFS